MINASFNLVPETTTKRVKMAPAYAELAKAQKAENKATAPKPTTKAPKAASPAVKRSGFSFDLEQVITVLDRKASNLKGSRGEVLGLTRSGMSVAKYVENALTVGHKQAAAFHILHIMSSKGLVSVGAKTKKAKTVKSTPAEPVAA